MITRIVEILYALVTENIPIRRKVAEKVQGRNPFSSSHLLLLVTALAVRRSNSPLWRIPARRYWQSGNANTAHPL